MVELMILAHPEIAAEWHPTKNSGVNISNIKENSSLKVWWQCSTEPKHEWQARVRNRCIDGNRCQYCYGHKKVHSDESLAVLFSDIAAELHPTKNGTLTAENIHPHSNKKVWWQCKKDPSHEWYEKVENRVRRKTRCKECSRLAASLAAKYPEIAKEWHPTKNLPLLPTSLYSKSDESIWWQCSANSEHVWKASVYDRTVAGASCRYCHPPKSPSRLPTLDIYSPELATQWHPTKNGSLKPSDVTSGSSRKVWWLCPNDPSHEWESTVCNRARKGHGCLYCNTKHGLLPYIQKEKSFAALYPELAAEWHPTKNGKLRPDQVTKGSKRRIWWQCSKDPSHEWHTFLFNRVTNKTPCPKCSTTTNSLKTKFPELAKQWHPTKNGKYTPNNVPAGSGRKIWWQCPNDPDHVWLAHVYNRTYNNSGCPICSRDRISKELDDLLIDSVSANTQFYDTFLANIETITKLAYSGPSDSMLTETYYRLLYAHIITAMETYLSDAFINTVVPDVKLRHRLMETTPEFREKKYRLTEVLNWVENTEREIKKYLSEIVYHNIFKVGKMYQDVLGVDFPADLQEVQTAVIRRHDIIHRNGRSKTGEVIRLKLKDILIATRTIKDFVAHVDKQLHGSASEGT